MELTHEFTVPATPEQAWSTFMEIERVGSCFPGATVTSATDEAFEGSVKVKLGPIALLYNGSGRFIDRDDAAHRAVIEAKGKDKRGNGTAGATVTIALSPDGAGTRVVVNTDLSITGKPAQFGRGVMQDVSDKLLQQFVTCIEGQFATAATDSTESDLAAAASEAGSAAAAAATDSPASGLAAADGAGSAASADSISSGPAPGGQTSVEVPPAPAEPPRSPTVVSPTRRHVPGPGDDSLDLGAAVLPAMLKAFAPYTVVGLIGVVIGYLIARRRW